ncbi:MAG: transporter substrate-binding protein [Planctomycetaceae bacterium]|nr:transporter substrate-binding protein [Planctomycetaceae bacterium]
MDDAATKTLCQFADQLPRLLLGQLAPVEAEQLRAHARNCASCQAALAAIEANLSGTTRGVGPQHAAGGVTHTDLRREMVTQEMPKLPESSEPPGETVLFDPAQHAATAPRAHSSASDSPRLSDVYLVSDFASDRSTAPLFEFLGPPSAPGDLGRLGDYRVLRVLGEGGMGLVFEAEDSHLQRRVALKVLRPELAANAMLRDRFIQEARSAASIPHDHIITIFQVGQHNNIPYLAMEFLHGETLDDRLKREGRLSIAETVRLGRQAALGLAAAHTRGLIHRDIKPANLWLESSPEGGPSRVKILDFGLARAAGSSAQLTSTGLIVGTPTYMSPEQARGLTLDPRTDLFSLGTVLYRTISGQLPFAGSDALAVLTSLAIQEAPPLEELVPEIPQGLAKLIHRLLAKDRELRPATAAQVADLLGRLEQGDEIVSGHFQSASRPAPSTGRRLLERRWLVGSAAAALVGGGIWAGQRLARRQSETARQHSYTPAAPFGAEPIKIGVLQSLSGTIALGGSAVVDATLLAVDELNHGGGLLGRQIEPVVVDGQTDDRRFAALAERLIADDHVATIFGCWTSASRKSVVPVVERHKHLLVYPLQYEGLEQSPHVVYTGAAPNQQILPALLYVTGILRKRRVFLVGSDYVFPRAANAIIRDALAVEPDVKIVGEAYQPLGSSELLDVVTEIRACQPDVILNTINGDTNAEFFRELRAAGIRSEQVPTISFSIGENELRGANLRDLVGDYSAWNYFQSVDRPQNAQFIAAFRRKYGPQRLVCDPMESGYLGVKLWAQGVTQANSLEPVAIRRAMLDQRLEAPEGKVRIDAETGHTWKVVRLGKITPEGEFDIVWSSEAPVRPEPFPSTRSRGAWEAFLTELYRGWGNRWEAPA